MPLIPSWNALHPLVVHFPIALLMIAPLLVLVGLLAPRARGILPVAFLVTLLGTAGAWLAVATGESAGQLAEHRPGVEQLLERHEDLAETTRTLFSVLTLAFGGLLAVPWALRREPSRAVRLGGYGALLVLHTAALSSLVLTAHQGGRLVHEQGVHAMIAPAPAAPAGSEGAVAAERRDED